MTETDDFVLTTGGERSDAGAEVRLQPESDPFVGEVAALNCDLELIRKKTPELTRGETSSGPPALDVLAMLLADKRSENTRRAYRADVERFFLDGLGHKADVKAVAAFLAQDTPQITASILQYKARLLSMQNAEATINRRLAAILSLVRFARRVGATAADPAENIDFEKAVAYRDTRGISLDQARQLLAVPNRATLKGKRDFVLLMLLLENALRRAEIVGTRREDYLPEERCLKIRGKGRGTQQERITLSSAMVAALSAYLIEADRCKADDRGYADQGRTQNKAACGMVKGKCVSYKVHIEGEAISSEPLFISVSPAWYGHALTSDGLYKIVRETAEAAGLTTPLSPHRLRHTAITLALDSAQGDIRKVQRLSRHARLETLQIYDDNRSDFQGEMTTLLSDIFHKEEQAPG